MVSNAGQCVALPEIKNYNICAALCLESVAKVRRGFALRCSPILFRMLFRVFSCVYVALFSRLALRCVGEWLCVLCDYDRCMACRSAPTEACSFLTLALQHAVRALFLSIYLRELVASLACVTLCISFGIDVLQTPGQSLVAVWTVGGVFVVSQRVVRRIVASHTHTHTHDARVGANCKHMPSSAGYRVNGLNSLRFVACCVHAQLIVVVVVALTRIKRRQRRLLRQRPTLRSLISHRHLTTLRIRFFVQLSLVFDGAVVTGDNASLA
jgi:hypothetical protein